MSNSEPAPNQTTIETGSELSGKILSSCPVRVAGSVDGQLKTPQLTLSRGGTVSGQINVGTLHSEGTLSGEIDAQEAYVAGKVNAGTVIRANTLEVNLSADRSVSSELLFTECSLEIGLDPETDMPPAS